MALNPVDIATVSRLLDDALALDSTDREAWLAALPAEHQRHAEALRDMLAQEAQLDTDPRLAAMPKLASDDAVAHAGDRIGPYRLLHEIGRGGMGSVWLAERADGAYKRQVALKLPRLAWGAGLAERMAREREIGMLLEHPNIARLYDAGVDGRGRPYLALEFVDGQPIDAWCEAQGLSVRDRLRLFVQVIKAVAYAHGRLVVHRDLKPSNVMVTPNGQGHLLDFGIAKLLHDAAADDTGLTQEQGRVLTPHYASPEQVAGGAITVQSDVYSLGVLLYELLTGVLPTTARRSTLGAVEDAILAGDVPPASSRVKDKAVARALRGEVDAILSKALQREPARRYATADAVALDIQRHLSGDTVSARPDSSWYRLRKAARRHWISVTAVLAVLVAVLSGSAVAVAQAQRAARAAERERVVKAFVTDVFRVSSQVDPKNAALRPNSPQALIERGARLIQERFAGQPELQAELFGVVGGVFSDMGAHKLASDYATKKVEALVTLRAEPRDQAKALLELGQTLFDDRRFADAELRVRRAMEMLSRGDDAQMLDALVLIARIKDDFGQGQGSSLQTAVNDLAARVPGEPDARPSVASAWLQFWQSWRSNDVAGVQRAIDTATRAEGPLSKTAIVMNLRLAEVMADSGPSKRELAQKSMDAAAAALRQLGGAHEIRAAFESAVFAARRYTRSGQISAGEAIAAIDQNRAVLTSSNLAMPDWFVPYVDFWSGLARLNHGDIRRGGALVEAAVPILRDALASPNDRWRVMRGLGEALMEAGRHGLAHDAFTEALKARRAIGRELDPIAAVDYLFIGQNLVMGGDALAAERFLDRAPDYEAVRVTGEERRQQRSNLRLKIMRAKAVLAGGNAHGAVELLTRNQPTVEMGTSILSEYNPVMGEALCTVGRTRDGLVLLRAFLADEEKTDYHPAAPWLARLRAVVGGCSLATSDRVAALKRAQQARAALTAQPEVSPYYKTPLFNLERALGLKLPSV